MQNLVPTQNEINEEIENLLIQNPNLQSFFTKIKNFKHLLDDLSKFDSTFSSCFSPDILEILCILILKGINFNFKFLMHKKNIHEKQNVKIKSKKMKENIKMPNLKRIIGEYLKSTNLKLDLKSIRIFIIYCILEERKGISLEDLSIKGENEISVYGGEVSTSSSPGDDEEGLREGMLGSGSSQEGLSQGKLIQEGLSLTNPSPSLDPLESLTIHVDPTILITTQDPITFSYPITPYVYTGPFQIFYFIHYLISNNLFSLRDSLLKSKFLCDWSLLSLPQMNNFVLNELRFIKDISILSSIILQCKSHLILLRFLPKLLFKLKFNRSFHILVLSSFDSKKVQDTSLLLIELYKEDSHKTNRILRDLIVGFKPPSLTQIFFNYFKDLNLNYFECLKIYLNNLPFLSKENLKKILKSEYFSILIEEIEDFNLVMNVMRDNNLMNHTIDILKRYKWSPTYKNIEKIKILYKIYAIEKSLFVEEIKKMVHEMHKQKRRYGNLKGSLKEMGSVKEISNVQDTLNDFTNLNKPNLNDSLSINNPTSSNKPLDNSLSKCISSSINTPTLNTPTLINSSSIISLFSNVSTIEDLSKVDFYKKQFYIKKSKKELGYSFSNTIKNLIDLIFIHRDESLRKSYLKKIYKLDPNQFLKNLKENQKEDVFFSKALKMGLKEEKKNKKNEINILILELPFYKKDDYWSVTLRKGLRFDDDDDEEGRGYESNEDMGYKGKEDNPTSFTTTTSLQNLSLNPTSLNTLNPLNTPTSLNPDHINIPPSLNPQSFYSYSTLKDSYLDLSQFNESKLILESKLEIEEILKNNKEVNLRKSIPKGIVMKESSIVIYKKLSKFILAMKVYQIEKEGIQIIIEISSNREGRGGSNRGDSREDNDSKYGSSDTGYDNNPNPNINPNPYDTTNPYFRLGSINGKLFYEILKGNLKERKFIDQDLENKDFIYFELISSGSKLKMNINSRVYNLTFFKIEKIVIGEGGNSFKGVINKFLLVEGSDYKNCRIVNLEGAYLYLKVLDRLERYLRYHNLFGVYLDSPYPYYFNKKEKIEFRNVM